MKCLILGHKRNGVQTMDKNGYFHFVRSFTDYPIGAEIEVPEPGETGDWSGFPRYARFRWMVLAGFAAACICALCFIAGRWSNVAYYIEIDGKSDIELAFNSMDFVVSVTGMDSEGEELLAREHFVGHGREAIEIALLAVEEKGAHIADAGNCPVPMPGVRDDMGDVEFIEVVVIARSVDKAMSICAKIAPYLVDPSGEIEIDAAYCDMDERDAAKEMGMSVGKLLLAEHLHEMNPEIPVEEITQMTIEEIYAGISDEM